MSFFLISLIQQLMRGARSQNSIFLVAVSFCCALVSPSVSQEEGLSPTVTVHKHLELSILELK